MNVEFINLSNLSEEDEFLAARYSEKFGIKKAISSLMISKGIKTTEDAENFLYPEKLPSPSPYLLTDMDKLVERVKLAADGGEKIVVYGDYDADGISAAYILFRAIKAYSANSDVSVLIPDRKFGYGLSEETVELLAEEFQPDLVVTCDLGISCKEEIRTLIEDAGIDVVVSDHHELSEELPDCPCVNPKRDAGKYPCIDLCGAGVAYKIAEALVPDKANDFLEFAALATVADSVPLISENRKIVKEGLKMMNNRPSTAIKALIDGSKIKGEITSSTIAFVMAPRINASGRIGVASRSLELFLEDDYDRAFEIVEDISKDNLARQKICSEIFESAYSQYNKESDTFGVVLANDNWHSGLLGIVASKISEEYHKPAILFTDVDGNYRGSGRSIEGINLFEALSSMTDLFITFGGHAQACGLTIAKKNFAEFKRRFNEYLAKNADISRYVPKVYYDVDCDKVDVDVGVLQSLALLEPFGVGNPKPCFLKTDKSLMLYPSSNPNHLIGDGKDKYLTCFNYGKYADVLRSGTTKKLILDYHIDEYNGKRSAKASLKSFYTAIDGDLPDEEELLYSYLFSLDTEYYLPLSEDSFSKLLSDNPFGVLAIGNTAHGINLLERLMSGKNYLEESGAIVIKSNLNRLLVSPETPINFEKFRTVVFAEEYANFPYELLPESAKIYTLSGKNFFEKLNVPQNRDLFIKCYMAIKALDNAQVFSYKNIVTPLSDLPITKAEIMTAFAVFKELGLIKIENGRLKVVPGKKVDLSQSAIYKELKK